MRSISYILINFIPLSLAGCSTHPLQDRTTGLELSQVVDKVRCEAKHAIDDLHYNEGFSGSQQKLDAIEGNIKIKADAIKAHLKRSGLILSATDAASKRRVLQIEKDELISEIESILSGNPGGPNISQRVSEIISRANKIQQDIDNIDKYQKLYYQQLLEERKKDDGFDQLIKFNESGMVHNFRFKITENNDLSSKGTIFWPINIGTASLGYDIGDKKQRVSERTVKLVATFKEIRATKNCQPPNDSISVEYPISGNLGLDEVINQYWKILNKSRLGAKGESYQDRIEFTTTINGSVNPKIVMAAVRSPNVTAEATLGAMRSDLHELTVFLAPREAADRPSLVSIVQAPDLNVKIIHGQSSFGLPVRVKVEQAD